MYDVCQEAGAYFRENLFICSSVLVRRPSEISVCTYMIRVGMAIRYRLGGAGIEFRRV